MYDAIVVGARCGGSPTAMLLARKGYQVLLVDRATFPSDTMSTHFVHPPGLAALARWGLLERLWATKAPAITKMSFDLGPFALVGAPPPAGDVAGSCAPRRTVLDKLLVDAAVDAGAELLEGFSVSDLIFDDGKVTGLRGRTKGGPETEFRAGIVVGADGLHSLVARAVDAPAYQDRGSLTCACYAYWADVPVDGGELYPRGDRFVIAFPTHDDLTVVVTMWPHAEASTFRRDVEANYLGTLDERVPELAQRVRGGRRQGHFVSTAELPNVFRRPFGPGWALVGDAGYHQDPLIAHGITNAFRDAELLAEAIDAGLSGQTPLGVALADYERRRNQAATPIFELNCQLASLTPPPPEMLQLFGALAGNQPDIDAFWGAIEGTVPIAEFFAPTNVERIVRAA